MKPPACFSDLEAKKEIRNLCRENDVDDKLLIDLCEIIAEHAGSGRKDGIIIEVTECIDRFIERSR